MDEEELQSGLRLNKYMADSGFCSRREADRLIALGVVTIDGRVGVLGDIVLDDMEVLAAGEPLVPKSPEEKIYIALHKPVGIVCTADEREPLNVVTYLGHPERVYPVGRLDKDSSGLLLLTNHGEIVNQILRAGQRHEKEYVVTVNKPVTPAFLRTMASGVAILDRVTMPCKIRQVSKFTFRITLVQGLNRQIRRMCEALSYQVRTLQRVRIMNIHLGELGPGQWRDLTQEELSELFRQLDGGFSRK